VLPDDRLLLDLRCLDEEELLFCQLKIATLVMIIATAGHVDPRQDGSDQGPDRGKRAHRPHCPRKQRRGYEYRTRLRALARLPADGSSLDLVDVPATRNSCAHLLGRDGLVWMRVMAGGGRSMTAHAANPGTPAGNAPTGHQLLYSWSSSNVLQ